jgi:AcrR family transcriptional regulator
MPKVSVQYEQQQKERIIQGAALAFAERGYRQTKIDDIASKLELSKGAIYIYFKSKEELFAAVYETYMTRRLTEIYQSYQPEDDVLVKLEKALDQFIAVLVSQDLILCRLWLEFYLEGPRVSAVCELASQLNESFYQAIYRLLAEGQESGKFRPDLDIASITSIILATCDGLMLRAMIRDKNSEPQAIRRAMWNTFYNLLKR